MKGVRGISQKGDVIAHGFGLMRDGFLKMPGAAFLKANPKIRRIDYTDIDSLLANRWEILTRLYSIASFKDYASEQFATVFYEALASAKDKSDLADTLHRVLRHEGGHGLAEDLGKQAGKVDTQASFEKWLRDAVSKRYGGKFDASDNETIAKAKPKDYRFVTDAIAGQIDDLYGREREWIVDQDEIVIPPRSVLFIKDNYEPDSDEEKEIRSRLKRYGIERRYRVRRIADKKFRKSMKRFMQNMAAYYAKHPEAKRRIG